MFRATKRNNPSAALWTKSSLTSLPSVYHIRFCPAICPMRLLSLGFPLSGFCNDNAAQCLDWPSSSILKRKMLDNPVFLWDVVNGWDCSLTFENRPPRKEKMGGPPDS